MSADETMAQYSTANHADNDTEINTTTSSNSCNNISFSPSVAKVNFIIANARSLAAKIESLEDNFTKKLVADSNGLGNMV